MLLKVFEVKHTSRHIQAVRLMLPKMPDIAWLRDGGCIAAAQTTDNGAAILEGYHNRTEDEREERRLEVRGKIGCVLRIRQVYSCTKWWLCLQRLSRMSRWDER